MFLLFTLAYFFRRRGAPATIFPAQSMELALNASVPGLLAGGHLFGFALTKLPLGHWANGLIARARAG